MRLVTRVEVDEAQADLQRRADARPADGGPTALEISSREAAEPGIAPDEATGEIHYLPLSGSALLPPASRAGRARLDVTAWHELELDDGRRVTLLDDRGWSTSGPEPLGVTLEEVESTSRTVVGPDEPYADRTYASMARDHWESLARTAADEGVEITADELRALPHDVVIGPQLQAVVDDGS